jgi:UDP-glucose 4-epimerase
MTVLITGGSGFLGSYIIDQLRKSSNIIVIGRNPSITNVKSLKKYEVPYIYTDYSLSSLKEIFKEFEPNAVVHMAARRPQKFTNNATDYLVNLKIALNVLECAIACNISSFVNISSRSVYSSKNTYPCVETEIAFPINNYGLSKLWVEDAMNYYSTQGLVVKSLRLAQVIGLGEREGYVLQTYLNEARKGLPLKVYGSSLGRRQYIYAKDVALAVDCALNVSDTSGIYNIGMPTNYSFMDLAECINAEFNNPQKISHLKDLPADETMYMMSIDKANKELGWLPKYDLVATYKDIHKDLKELENL